MERIVGFNLDVLLGIRDFAGPSRGWMCHFTDPRPEHVSVVSAWEPSGLLAFLLDPAVEQRVLDLGRPVVDVANWLTDSPVSRVSVNDREVGRLGADHLAGLGFQSFAFAGNLTNAYAQQRFEGFKSRLEAFDHHPQVYSSDPQRFPRASAWTMGTVDEEFLEWVVSLPKPVAIFADNDDRALVVSETCRFAGLNVPDDVAILGVDDDPYLCASGYPQLSSIAIPARRIGYEAAAMLERLMNGGSPRLEPILLPPIGVVSRRSTDVLAIEDPDVAIAIRYIRTHACTSISVEDVVDQVPIGRRTLEKLFLKHIGRTPLQEIQHVRIAQAQTLLATTDLTINAIALRSGYSNGNWFSTAFQSQTGQSPAAYRRSFLGSS